jgi:hypothetical protein
VGVSVAGHDASIEKRANKILERPPLIQRGRGLGWTTETRCG